MRKKKCDRKCGCKGGYGGKYSGAPKSLSKAKPAIAQIIVKNKVADYIYVFWNSVLLVSEVL